MASFFMVIPIACTLSSDFRPCAGELDRILYAVISRGLPRMKKSAGPMTRPASCRSAPTSRSRTDWLLGRARGVKSAQRQCNTLAFLYNPTTATYAEYYLKPFKAAAASLAVEATALPARDTSELESVVATYAREPNGA